MSPEMISAVVKDLLNFKQGYKTSEFWVALSPIVVGILSVFGVGVTNNSLNHFIVVAWGAVAASYVGGRSLLKTARLHHTANLSASLHSVEHDLQAWAEKYVGPAGPPGPTGDPGPVGDKGEQGEPGKSVAVEDVIGKLIEHQAAQAAPVTPQPTTPQV